LWRSLLFGIGFGQDTGAGQWWLERFQSRHSLSEGRVVSKQSICTSARIRHEDRF
jgi:hypothetical protein